MSLSSSKPPAPLDAGAVADKQQEYNTTSGEASQAGSNINQNNAFGSLNFAQTGTGPGGVPLYTANSSLSPEQQQIFDALQSGSTKLLQNANYGAQNPSDVIGNATSGATQDYLKKQTDYLNPYFIQQTSELDTKLRNQGLLPSQSSNPSDPSTWGPYEKAMNAARQSQTSSVGKLAADFEPQAYSQAQQDYLMPLNTAGAAINLGSGVGNSVKGALAPTAGLTINPANYTGAVAQQENIEQQNYKAQMEQKNAMINGLFKLGSAGLGLATGGASLPFTSMASGFGGMSGGSGSGYDPNSNMPLWSSDGQRPLY